MPFFNNFILDGLLLLGGIFLIPLIVGVGIFVGHLGYAVTRALWDKYVVRIEV